MPEYLAPGVYVEETSFRARSIEGVSTSTTAFVGPTRKGPLSRPPDHKDVLTPEVITSLGEFERVYGGLSDLSIGGQKVTNYLAHAVKAFFDNGGGRLFVARTFAPTDPADRLSGFSRSDPILTIGDGTAANVARFEARMPGSALNGKVEIQLQFIRLSDRGARQAPTGTLLHSGPPTPAPARPACLGGARKPPFALPDGGKLVIDFQTDGGLGNKQVTFTGKVAEVVGRAVANPAAIEIPENTVLQVTVAGHPRQEIRLTQAGQGQAERTRSLADWAALIGSALRFASASVRDGNRLVLSSHARGKAAEISVSEVAPLGLAAPAPLQATGASSAEVVGNVVANPAAIEIPEDTELQVTVAGQPPQDIRLTEAGQAVADRTRSLADWAALIGGALRFASASVRDGNRLVLSSHARGKAAEIRMSEVVPLGLTAPALLEATGASSNVADLDAVLVEEIDALLGPEVRTGTAENGAIEFVTQATGQAVRLKVAGATDAAVSAAFGVLEENEQQGQAGTDLVLYRRAGDGLWSPVDGAGGPPDFEKETYQIALSAVVTDADGNQTIYEDLGLTRDHPRWIGTVLTRTPSRKSDALTSPVYLHIGQNVLNLNDMEVQLVRSLFKHATPGNNRLTAVFRLSQNQDNAPDDGTWAPAVGPDDAAKEMTASYKDALALLETIEDISIVAAPGYTAAARPPSDVLAIQQEILTHVDRATRYRIAVLDTRPELLPGQALEARSQIDSTHAALYYPWVYVANPAARANDDRIPKEIPLPPSGFVCGIYARTDIQRGVWKAPANEVVRGALRFERDITHGQQELLNPMGVNCLRFFFGRGNRLWGARTASSDSEWKYVNVRRYFNYLERSIDRATQWVVFEPNGEALWAGVREMVSAFLFNEWRSGALLGSKPEEAFFVRCDRSTMTQNDLDNGRLICLVGVAALKPAEFVIFRIGQKTADART